MPRHTTTLAFALAAPLALAACISAPRSKVIHLAPPPVEVAPAPLPLKLGVHLAPDFTAAWWASGIDVVPVGADSEVLLRQVLGRLVGPVPEIAAAPPFAGAPPPVDLVLVPSLADFSTFGFLESVTPAHAVAWRLALFEPDGDLVSSWLVRGEVQAPPPPARAPDSAEDLEAPPEPEAPKGITHSGVSLSEAGRRLASGHRADAHLDDYLARRAAGGPAPLAGLEVSAALEDQPLDFPGAGPTFTGSGFVPVRIKLTNRTAQVVRLDGLFTQLRLADGRVIHQVGPGMVMNRIQLAGAFARLEALNTFLGGAIAGLMVSAQQIAAQPTVEAQVAALGLEPGAVAPGATLEGLVTFLPQRGGPASGPATVEVWVTDAERRPLRVSVPILVPPPTKSTVLPVATTPET